MSRTNYEAVADFAGRWLHRAQVSLLTGATGQIKLSHIRKKNPGAGLVRAWCGPGAGLVRAWCGPGAGLVRASLARSPTDCDTCGNLRRRGVGVFDTPTSGDACEGGVSPTPESQRKLLQTAGTPQRTCEGALRKYNTPAL